MDAEVYGFIGEWYDPAPQLKRQFLVKVFTESGSFEIVDLKTKRCFLKKSKLQAPVTPAHFNVGGKVMLNARLFELVDYADPYTRRQLASSNESAVVVLSPDCYQHVGKALRDIQAAGFQLHQLQTVQLSEPELEELLPGLGVEAPWGQHVSMWVSGPVVAIQVKGRDCAQRVPDLVQSLQARFARSPVERAAWTGPMLSNFFFSGARAFQSTATLSNCTCAVVRPHAFKAGHAPQVVDRVQDSGLVVTAMRVFQLDRAAAAEFLEVYQGVVQEFDAMVDELCTGPVLAMEVVHPDGPDGAACRALRDLAGPWDVEMARELAPKSIRAELGLDRVRNTVHCTDLPEDGASECAYFFEILSAQR